MHAFPIFPPYLKRIHRGIPLFFLDARVVQWKLIIVHFSSREGISSFTRRSALSNISINFVFFEKNDDFQSKHKHDTCTMSFDWSQMMMTLSSFDCNNKTKKITLSTLVKHISSCTAFYFMHWVISEMEKSSHWRKIQYWAISKRSRPSTHTIAESFFRQNCFSYPEIQPRRKKKKFMAFGMWYLVLSKPNCLCQYVRSTIPTKKHIVE